MVAEATKRLQKFVKSKGPRKIVFEKKTYKEHQRYPGDNFGEYY